MCIFSGGCKFKPSVLQTLFLLWAPFLGLSELEGLFLLFFLSLTSKDCSPTRLGPCPSDIV